MRKNLTHLLILLSLAFVTACKRQKDEAPQPSPPQASTDITYSAAYIINGGSNSISVIELSTNQVKRTIPLNVMWSHHVYINPGKTEIAIGVPGMDFSAGHSGMPGMPGKSIILNSITGATLKIIDLPVMNHNTIFSPDGTEIWTSQMDSAGTVLVYDASNYTLKKTISVGEDPTEVTFSADGSMAFVANSGSNTVTCIAVATKMIMAVTPVGLAPIGAWAGSNNKMYVDNETGQSISVIDVSSMAVDETVSLGFTPGMAAYKGGAVNELWVTDPNAGKVHYFQRMSNAWMDMGAIACGAGTHAVVFNGMIAYVTNQMAGTVSVIDIANKVKKLDITVGTKPNGIIIK